MTNPTHFSRRRLIQAGAAASAALGAPGLLLAQARTVKIGLVHPVSGALAYSGGQSRMGAQLAIDEINAAGGIRSMGGAKLEAHATRRRVCLCGMFFKCDCFACNASCC